MLTGFDVAKTTEARAHTVADLVLTTTDPAYVAPECQASPAAASPASDVYSAGVMFAEMFLGAPPFSSATEQHEAASVLPVLELRDAGRPPKLQRGCSGCARPTRRHARLRWTRYVPWTRCCSAGPRAATGYSPRLVLQSPQPGTRAFISTCPPSRADA